MSLARGWIPLLSSGIFSVPNSFERGFDGADECQDRCGPDSRLRGARCGKRLRGTGAPPSRVRVCQCAAAGAAAGLGGGGFSGGAGGSAQGQSAGKGTVTAGRRPTGIQQVAADPTDNSFIVRGSAESIREINRLIEKGEVSPKVKVDKTLLDAKTTKVEVQVYVTDVSDEVVKALKKAA